MNSSTRARISSRSAHPSLKASKSQRHSPHSRNIHYPGIGGLRRKASEVERWLGDREQVAPTASRRYELLVHGDSGVIPVD